VFSHVCSFAHSLLITAQLLLNSIELLQLPFLFEPQNWRFSIVPQITHLKWKHENFDFSLIMLIVIMNYFNIFVQRKNFFHMNSTFSLQLFDLKINLKERKLIFICTVNILALIWSRNKLDLIKQYSLYMWQSRKNIYLLPIRNIVIRKFYSFFFPFFALWNFIEKLIKELIWKIKMHFHPKMFYINDSSSVFEECSSQENILCDTRHQVFMKKRKKIDQRQRGNLL